MRGSVTKKRADNCSRLRKKKEPWVSRLLPPDKMERKKKGTLWKTEEKKKKTWFSLGFWEGPKKTLCGQSWYGHRCRWDKRRKKIKGKRTSRYAVDREKGRKGGSRVREAKDEGSKSLCPKKEKKE